VNFESQENIQINNIKNIFLEINQRNRVGTVKKKTTDPNLSTKNKQRFALIPTHIHQLKQYLLLETYNWNLSAYCI